MEFIEHAPRAFSCWTSHHLQMLSAQACACLYCCAAVGTPGAAPCHDLLLTSLHALLLLLLLLLLHVRLLFPTGYPPRPAARSGVWFSADSHTRPCSCTGDGT
jgi:hypothetical protein